MCGVPAEGGSEAYLVRTPQRRASARGTRLEDGSPQMGLFQQPAKTRRDRGQTHLAAVFQLGVPLDVSAEC